MEQPTLRLLLLGPPRLEQGEQPLHLATRKALALLAFVAVERSGASRSQLAHLLWPENAEEQARASLRQELSRLGQSLGNVLQKPSQQLLRLDPAGIQVDLWDFWDAIRSGQHHKALELYRGSFLQGLQLRETAAFESWQEQIRLETQQQYLQSLSALATAFEQAGNLAGALALRRQAIAADPLAEHHYLEAMRLSERLGDRAGALRLYQNLEQALTKELGLPPSPEAQALARVLTQVPSRPRLPTPTTALVGRDTEQTEVLQLLGRSDCRLLNLVGPGGVGKTRLALAVAEQLASQTPAPAVYWVALQGRPLLTSIAEGLGLPTMGQGDLGAAVVHRLREQPTWLFLDEAEGLSTPAELEHLLRESPSTKLLLTSRERFRLQSEWIYEVKGLEYPEEDRFIQRSQAAELFRRCAQRVAPHFRPSPEDWAAIAQICRLLSGLPLGLELAAALVRVMSCREIAQSLEQGLGLLEDTLADLPARHASLRTVLESSLAQLTPAQRQTLQALAVFEGSFDLEAAQAIANATLPALTTLLDRALLQKTPDGYRILTVIRQHLLPRIPDATRLAHARYFAELLKTHEQGLRGGSQGEALPMFIRQYPNLKAAWNWALAHGHEELALEMIDGLFLLFELWGWFAEGEALMSRVVTSPHRTLQSLALCRQGRFLYHLGDSAGSQKAIEQSLSLGQGVVDGRSVQVSPNGFGQLGAQELAAVEEHRPHEIVEKGAVGEAGPAGRIQRNMHDGRMDLRAGPKHRRRHHPHHFDLALALHPNAQRPVILGGGGGHQAVGQLFLDGDRHGLGRAVQGQEIADQRGGDVERQVGHQLEPSVRAGRQGLVHGGQNLGVELAFFVQGVQIEHPHVGQTRQLFRGDLEQRRIHFHGNHHRGLAGHQGRQRARAGADL